MQLSQVVTQPLFCITPLHVLPRTHGAVTLGQSVKQTTELLFSDRVYVTLNGLETLCTQGWPGTQSSDCLYLPSWD